MNEETKGVSVNVSGLGMGMGLGRAEAHATITLDLSPEATQALNRLMSETGDSPSVLFRKALGLYALAMEAKREKKSVGIAESADVLETEFVGL
jgi:hypothetical protein